MSLRVAVLLALVISAIGVIVMRRIADRLPLAAVNDRSLHGVPVPRVGGLALWAAWLPSALFTLSEFSWLAPLLLVIAVSALDDWRGAHPALRFALQLVAACWWMASIPGSHPLLTQLFGILVLVWGANLYNFMDGIDGLAACMALVGFGAYAVAAGGMWHHGQGAAILVVASIVPLLAANWPPAKMFIGDVGAVPLGFLAAVFGIEGITNGVWPAWFPLLVFLPFWTDATFTLCKRLLKGERIWVAHREHGYQQLVLLGLGHQGALAVYGLVMLGCGGSALYALIHKPSLGTLLTQIWSALVLVTLIGIDMYYKKKHG